MAQDGQLTALKAVWLGIEAADRGVVAYLAAGGSPEVAVEALTHPMKGLQGLVEMRMENLCPDALGAITDPGGAIDAAYAAYDGDPRANGPDDRDAFVDAVSLFVTKTGDHS